MKRGRGLLRLIKVEVTPMPFPKAQPTMPSTRTVVFSVTAPEAMKMVVRPIVRPVYAAMVSQ